MRNILQLLLLTILVISANAELDINLDCQTCGNVVCLIASGGPFGNGISVPQNATSCPNGYPIGFDFSCSTQCSGCMIASTSQGQPDGTTCSNSQLGQVTIALLDDIYSYQQGSDTVLSYDWCNCPGGLSTGALVGIIVGSIVGATVIGGLIWYCFCRKKSFDNYTAK